MKAFIIHTPAGISVDYAKKALASFAEFAGWEPRLFLGVTPETLGAYEKKYPLKTKARSRAMAFYRQRHKNTFYRVKKSCSYNHYRLFRICVELGELIAVIEHDSHCIGDWQGADFDDILILNIDSALKNPALKNICPRLVRGGVNDFWEKILVYRHDPAMNGATVMPGTAAYAVTPQGAEKMLAVYENIGWEQSDFIINTHYVRLQTLAPELFTFKLKNLASSTGHTIP